MDSKVDLDAMTKREIRTLTENQISVTTKRPYGSPGIRLKAVYKERPLK
jgi:hypothetical protein